MVEICGVYIGECIKFEYFSEQEMTRNIRTLMKILFWYLFKSYFPQMKVLVEFAYSLLYPQLIHDLVEAWTSSLAVRNH